MKLLTNLIFEPKGMHNPALAYNIKDTVMSADGSKVYFALQDVPAGTELDNEDYWKLQINLSASKNALDAALAAFGSCAKAIGMRVRGETAKASGKPVSFLPDAGSLLQPVTVLEPKQQGSGEPSPDNVRPFIGWDKLGLTVAGRNLLPDFKNTTINGVTLKKLDDGGFTLSGTASALTYFTVEFAPVLPAAKYTISMNNSETNSRGDFWFGMFDESDERLDADIFGSVNRKRSVTIAKDIRYFKIQVPGGLTLNNFVIKPQVEKGDAATEYSTPSRVCTVQIGQTVYGGRFDWLTGKLVATHTGMDMGSMDWNYVSNSEYTCFCVPTSTLNVKPAKSLTGIAGIWCSIFKPASWVDVYNRTNNTICVMDSGSLLIRAYTDKYTNAADFKAATTGQMVVWELATPIEIGPFTPHIISAAEPEQTNTLYGDGSIEVEYVKPLHVSIEERVAAALAAAMNTEGV